MFSKLICKTEIATVKGKNGFPLILVKKKLKVEPGVEVIIKLVDDPPVYIRATVWTWCHKKFLYLSVNLLAVSFFPGQLRVYS